MALKQILLIPDVRLRQIAEPVVTIDQRIKTLVKDMFETMYDAPGIGLAAPQVGIMKRLIVLDCAKREDEDEREANSEDDDGENSDLEAEQNPEPEPEPDPDPITMVNPEIIWFSDELSVYEEGCLSIPDYYEDVERPTSCTVRYMDMDGKTIERELDGLLSTCVQHEVDHLDGKLFIDYLSRLKRERITKKFQKAARRAAE